MDHFLPSGLVAVYDLIKAYCAEVIHIIANPRRLQSKRIDLDNILNKSESLSTLLMQIIDTCVEDFSTDLGLTGNAMGGFATRLGKLREEFNFKNYRDLFIRLPPQYRRRVNQRIGNCSDEIMDMLCDTSAENYSLAIVENPDNIKPALRWINEFFSLHLKYLGPLRDEPKSVYPLAGSTETRDVGIRGEHTAAVLDIQ